MAAEEITFRAKILKGFFWLSTGSFIGQTISWLSTIFVIRLLLPSDYGLMAMATSITTLLMTISELGICSSIIQAREITEKEIRQVFGFGILTNLLAGVLCFMAAPIIASFYHEQKLIPLIRLLSVDFIIIIFYMVPESLYIREMNFKVKAIIDVSAQVGASILTLVLALYGLGVWALTAGLLAPHIIKAVSYNVGYSVRLKPIFNFKGAENYIKYGFHVTGSRLLYYLHSASDLVIVGKFLGNYLLGIYGVAINLASIPVDKVLPIINQVSFTSYSRIQNDPERVMKNVLRATRTMALVSFPIFFGMASVAKKALPLILGVKWAGIVVPFQLLCIVLPLKALSPLFNQAVFAIGKARVNVINSAIIFVVMAVSFLVGIRYGIAGVCYAWVIGYPAVFIITGIRSLRVLGITPRNYVSEIIFPFIASAVMAISLMLLSNVIATFQPLVASLFLITAGVSIYVCISLMFRKNDYLELMRLLQR